MSNTPYSSEGLSKWAGGHPDYTGSGAPQVGLGGNIAGEDIENDVLKVGQLTPWTAHHAPAADAKATVTKAAATAGSGLRHVCTGIAASIAANGAPAQTVLYVNLIDGASGGTTYLRRVALVLVATAGVNWTYSAEGLWLVGTAETGMTLEFSALLTNTTQCVSMSGVSIT